MLDSFELERSRFDTTDCLVWDSSHNPRSSLTSLPRELLLMIASQLGSSILAIPLKLTCQTLYYTLPSINTLKEHITAPNNRDNLLWLLYLRSKPKVYFCRFCIAVHGTEYFTESERQTRPMFRRCRGLIGVISIWNGIYLGFESLKRLTTEYSKGHSATVVLDPFPSDWPSPKIARLTVDEGYLIKQKERSDTNCTVQIKALEKDGLQAWMMRTTVTLRLDKFVVQEIRYGTNEGRLQTFLNDWNWPLCPHISFNTDGEIFRDFSEYFVKRPSPRPGTRKCPCCPLKLSLS